jgi:predicted nucleic acid-binding protein
MPESRIAFADANWLVAAYHASKHDAVINAWGEHPSTLIVTDAVLAEAHCAFWRLGNRAEALAAAVKAKQILDCGYTFESLAREAGPVWKKYGSRFHIGTLDTLHVLAARRFGCQWFLSFDTASGCRALAAVLGLRVFPDLTAEDRKIMAKLRH